MLTIPWPNSLGLFYAAFTEHLGFQAYSDEWKVMGLAPYGQPGADLRDFIALDHRLYRVNAPALLGRGNGHVSAIERRLGPRRPPESAIESRHKDVAFAVQDACEQAVMTHGGFGYAKEFHVERYLRESLIPRIAPISPQLILSFIAEKVLGLPKSY